jgi:hypothetical protein
MLPLVGVGDVLGFGEVADAVVVTVNRTYDGIGIRFGDLIIIAEISHSPEICTEDVK